MTLFNRIIGFRCRFLGYKIYILYCVPASQSQIFCHHVLGILHPHPPIPFGNHYTAICVHEFQLYIPHMSETIWFLPFSDWLTALSIILSRSICVVTNGSIFFFFNGWVVFHCVYVPHLFYPIPYRRTLWLSLLFI